MRKSLLLLCLLFFSCSWVVSAPANTGSDLTALSWMTGHWVRMEGEKSSEELWMSPTENLMLGLNTTVVKGRTRGFEFLRIRMQDGKIEYVAMPGGRGEIAFVLVEHGEKRVVFENPEHDFPQRILYWLDGEERLHARIEGEEDGKTKGFGWFWERK